MATMINRVAIGNETAWLHLYPGGLTVVESPQLETNIDTVPNPSSGESGFIVHSQVQGWKIQVTGRYKESDVSSGLSWQDSLIGALFDDDGLAREVDFCRWVDEDGEIARIYRGCKCIEAPEFDCPGEGSDASRKYTFTLVTGTRTRYATGAAGSYPGTSPYEDHLINSESTIVAYNIQTQELALDFPGVAQTCDDTNEASMSRSATVRGNVTSWETFAYEIEGVKSLSGDASRSTVIRVSNQPRGSVGSNVDLTIAGDSTTPSISGGAITIVNNSKLYAYCLNGDGQHEDLRLRVWIREKTT